MRAKNRLTPQSYWRWITLTLVAFLPCCSLLHVGDKNKQTISLLVGTYTESYDKKVSETKPYLSQGIYALEFDPINEKFVSEQLLSQATNPSYGVLNHTQERFYSVSETASGTVLSFSLNRSEPKLEEINSKSAIGDYPCYIALSPSGDQIAVANYGSGTVTIYQIESLDGSIGQLIASIKHKGGNPHSSRQKSAHSHWVRWSRDGERLYVVDLGIDKVMVYERANNWRKGRVALDLAKNSGPRHMVFHPKRAIAYVMNELNNTVVSTKVGVDGTLTVIQELSTLPNGFDGKSQGGHIALSSDGNSLYVSNRGHNSLAVYRILQDGNLRHLQTIDSGGIWPRFFLIAKGIPYAFVANQHSHNIVLFKVQTDGTLTQLDASHLVPEPVYLSQFDD